MPGRLIELVPVAIVLGIGVATSWAAMDTMIHHTSDDAFCTNCHSHQPIGTSYRESLHGGNNAQGWRATCAQCHIPHDNSLHYLWVKTVHGIRDPLVELVTDPYDIDWHAHREKREHYVYDSACMGCHKNLEGRSLANSKAFLPHRDYFAQPDEHKCVSCHKHVGHNALGNHLEAMGWRKPGQETP